MLRPSSWERATPWARTPALPPEAEPSLPAASDVVVVGAGPAGASCAGRLAESGLDVLVVELRRPPRYKTCGGGVVGRVRSLVGGDLAGVVERSCERLELNLVDAGLTFAVDRRPAPVLMTMRSAFDARLTELAVEAGARLVAPCRFRGLERREDRIEVVTDRGTVVTRFVVGADGVGSRVARAAGWDVTPRTVPAIESEISVAPELFERYRRSARFDFGFVPHGYAWVFPKREHLSVGCLTRAPDEVDLPAAFEGYLASRGLDAGLGREDHGFAIPVRPRASRLGREGVLLVGDAAGLADPLTCEGISHALASGRLAAQAIVDAGDRREAVADRYGALLAGSILRELRWSRRLAPLLYDFPRLRAFVFRRVGDRLCRAMADVFVGRRTYRDLVGRPGTYARALAQLMRPASS